MGPYGSDEQVAFDGVGHGPHIDHPIEFRDAFFGFLAEVAGRAA